MQILSYFPSPPELLLSPDTELARPLVVLFTDDVRALRGDAELELVPIKAGRSLANTSRGSRAVGEDAAGDG
jgi:hypothetical protein